MNRSEPPERHPGPAHQPYISALGHEIRRPLNGILGTIDLLLAGARDPQQRELLTRLEGHASSLAHLVNDLIDLSRMDAKDLELDELEFDLRRALQTIITSLAIEAEQKGLALRYSVADEVPGILRGDPGRLKQALFNLVASAVRFTTAGEIGIRVTGQPAADGRIALGFAIDCAGTVEFPKGLVDALRSPAGTGDGADLGRLGLGLLIARRIAALMDGEVGIDPQDRWSRRLYMQVRLPIGQQAAGDLAPVFPGVLQGLRALLVDPSTESRRTVKEFLQGWGVVAAEAGSSAAALSKMSLAAADGSPFQLVMLDDGMAGNSGFDLAQQIKQRHDLCSTTIVLLTSAGMRGDAARCRRVGVSAYLTKPIRPSRLLEALALALGASQDQAGGTLITRHTLEEGRRSAEGAPPGEQADSGPPQSDAA